MSKPYKYFEDRPLKLGTEQAYVPNAAQLAEFAIRLSEEYGLPPDSFLPGSDQVHLDALSIVEERQTLQPNRDIGAIAVAAV